MNHSIICWFWRDLRLHDNPALNYACQTGLDVIPVYIHAPQEEAPWSPGAASRWWLHHSLQALDQTLQARGSRLILRTDNSLQALLDLIDYHGVVEVTWNRRYEPTLLRRDHEISQALLQRGIKAETFNANVWFEPWALHKNDGQPYKVFTPFWKRCLQGGLNRTCVPLVQTQHSPKTWPDSMPLQTLALLPKQPWDTGLQASWQPGEHSAWQNLTHFLAHTVGDYAKGRDRPDQPATSRLSPHLRFGEISVRQIHAACEPYLDQAHKHAGIEAFVRELGWREFAYYVLYHFPHTTEAPLNPRFINFPWQDDSHPHLEIWQRGMTGIPMVDAGMRELWQTGWMHNRVRMIVASLLTKNLGIHWLCGARWFWDTLVDADLASNSMGWQWTAGCGADAAPFFRVFNPVLQGERFDPDGHYVRRFIPELGHLSTKTIHKPWQQKTTRSLGFDGLAQDTGYPAPLVDLQHSRERALGIWKALSK